MGWHLCTISGRQGLGLSCLSILFFIYEVVLRRAPPPPKIKEGDEPVASTNAILIPLARFEDSVVFNELAKLRLLLGAMLARTRKIQYVSLVTVARTETTERGNVPGSD